MNSCRRRNAYHTHIKSLARDGLLPEAVLKQIPRSNIHRWKFEGPDKYLAFDINVQSSYDYDLIKEFARHQTAKRVFSAYVRVIKTVLSIAHALPGFHKAVKERTTQMVQIVNRSRPLIGLRRTLRFFNLTVSTFRQWSLQSFTECFESATHSCNRIFPNQLSRPQVALLRESLLDPRFQYWPVSSIALYALRNNVLALCLNTWYKYVHKLGIVRSRPESRRKKNTISIRALHPHQIWHADITAFVTADHVKHYIYLVVDNFSRKILSWKVADSVKAATRQATIKQALECVTAANDPVTLITDGGPENNLKSFVNGLSYPIQHRTALVDGQVFLALFFACAPACRSVSRR